MEKINLKFLFFFSGIKPSLCPLTILYYEVYKSWTKIYKINDIILMIQTKFWYLIQFDIYIVYSETYFGIMLSDQGYVIFFIET